MEVKQCYHIGTLGFVIDLSPPLTLLLRDELPHVFGDELVLAGFLSNETAPASDVAGRHEEFLAELPLDHDVPAGVGGGVPVQLTVQTTGAEVRVALSAGEVTGALVTDALGLTLAPGEPETDKLSKLKEYERRKDILMPLKR